MKHNRIVNPNTSPRKAIGPSSIRKYWAPLLWRKKGYDSEYEFLAEKTCCFACGLNWGAVEAAHIVARCYGGEDKVENLHLLCDVCHKTSENCSLIVCVDSYFDWFYERTSYDAIVAHSVMMGANLGKFLTTQTK